MGTCGGNDRIETNESKDSRAPAQFLSFLAGLAQGTADKSTEPFPVHIRNKLRSKQNPWHVQG